ncbi:MAG: hypothetical protein ACTHMV_13510 [Chitinophagaceae bacterium]
MMENNGLEKYGDYLSNREVIETYLVNEEGTVQLNDKQKQLLDRWSYADELIRKNEMRRETIALMLIRQFKVSRATAYQDIVNAENVFASSTPLNKKYRIQLRIEFIEMKINELYDFVVPPPAEESSEARMLRKLKNEYYLNQAISLEKVLQKYYHDYPDLTPSRSPKNIILQVNYNSLPSTPMSAGEALQKAAGMLNIKPNDITDGSGE